MTNILSDPSYFLPPLIAVAVTLALLIVALLWSRRDLSTGLFCGLLMSLVIWNLLIFGMRSSPDVHHALPWAKAAVIPATATFLFYYHFTLIYTNNKGQRRILYASYLLLAVFAVLSPTGVFVEGMRVEPYGYAPIMALGSYLLFPVGPLLTLGGAFNLLKYYKVCPSHEEKNRLTYLAIAAAFPIIGGLLDGFTNLPPVLIWSNLIFCILCSIAILKYRLLDIQIFIRKSLVYIVVSVIAAIPYVSILFLVNEVLRPEIETWWVHAVMLLLLAIVLRPLYGWAQNLVDRLFYRDRYDYLKALEQFAYETRSIAPTEELGSTLVKLISGALRSSTACLLLPAEGSNGFSVASCVGLDKPPSKVVISGRNPLLKWLKRHGRILSSEELKDNPDLRSFANMGRQDLENLRAELYVPIKTHEDELSAVLILGEKLSQQPYLDEDRRLLSTLTSQMAINLENAQLYEEARRSEEALRESEEKLRLIFKSVTDGVAVTDLNGVITELNERAMEIHGFDSKDDILGKHPWDFIARSEHQKVAEHIRQTLKQQKPTTVEYTLLRADGSEFPGEISASLLKDASGNLIGFVGIIRDITERKQAEEREKQLQQEVYLSSRLASIGELAAGVAHEINNPLTGILGFSQRLSRKSTDETFREDLERIHNEAQRAAKVVKSLLTFARRGEQKKEYSNINDVVQKALELRAYELKTSDIEVVTNLATTLPYIMVDSHQIQEVFLNIILNAEQAMTEVNHRGELTIKTQENKGYIRVSFTDNGPGIATEHLDKLFDPFFTTRGGKGGTGLGLSVCHGIVAEHGGRIYVKSKPGKGTTFFVELPLKAEKIDEGKVLDKEPIRKDN